MVANPIVENAASHSRATAIRSLGSGDKTRAISMVGICMADRHYAGQALRVLNVGARPFAQRRSPRQGQPPPQPPPRTVFQPDLPAMPMRDVEPPRQAEPAPACRDIAGLLQ